MKHTKDAIRYGIETLRVSPDEMFKLIESSNGYVGDDYQRWLANEIIKIAEKDGVGFSQLLVKKFNILQDMLNNEDAVIRDVWIDYMKKENGYSIDFEEVGTELDVEDWFEGVDLDKENSFFTKENLEELYNRFINREDVTLSARLSTGSVSKSSELYQDAKSRGVDCTTEGALLLYRMCSIVEAFDLGTEFEFNFLVNTDFIMNKENEGLWKYFFQYFSLRGFVVTPQDLFDGVLGGNQYAYITCKPRVGEVAQDCIALCNYSLDAEGKPYKVKGSKVRYTKSSIDLLSYIKQSVLSLDRNVSTYKEDFAGNISKEAINTVEGVIGYINFSHSQGLWLSSLPTDDIEKSIPITKKNLGDCIIYYAVSTALKMFNINEEIKLPINGSKEYKKLLGNCLPLFLFSNRSIFRGYKIDGVPRYSAFDLENSDYIDILLSKYEIYFSFEAKELVNLCRGYSKFLVEGCNDHICTKCFNDVRQEANHSEFNNLYLTSIRNLCDYIKGLYREVL